MKFFAIFAAILALAFARSRNGIYELSEAIQNPNTDPAMIPYLEAALNELMLAAMTQPAVQPAPVAEPAVDIAAIDSLLEAISNPNTDPAMVPFLEAALNDLLVSVVSPISPIPVVSVPEPVAATSVLTTWSLQELSAAIQDPNTDPELLPYLEDGLNAIMANLMSGDQQEYVVIALPAHLVPITQEVAPVVEPTPVEQVVVPAPVEQVVAAQTSPLVQIIVNVNSEAAAAPVAPSPVVPSPVVLPSPVPVEEWVPPTRPEPEHSIVPLPVNPVDSIAVQPPQVVVVGPSNPIDVIAVAAPEVNPIDVIAVAAPEVNPIDVIAVAAPEVNPIDVIAVAAPEVNPVDVIAVSAPEVNPIDILHPVPAVSAVGVVGPFM